MVLKLTPCHARQYDLKATRGSKSLKAVSRSYEMATPSSIANCMAAPDPLLPLMLTMIDCPLSTRAVVDRNKARPCGLRRSRRYARLKRILVRALSVGEARKRLAQIFHRIGFENQFPHPGKAPLTLTRNPVPTSGSRAIVECQCIQRPHATLRAQPVGC